MIDFSAPLAGLDRASTQLNRAASQIAQSVDPTDSVDLSAAAVAMIKAKVSFEASVKALKVEQQVAQSTIDLIG